MVQKRGQQRVGSSAVRGVVRQLGALATPRLALRAVVTAGPAWLAQEVPAGFVAAYAQSRADFLAPAHRMALPATR